MRQDNVKKEILVELPYAGCLAFYHKIKQYESIKFEQCEHFVKASYRNRCHIATPDGMLTLSIPLERGRGQRRNVKEIKISTEYKWQKKHWDSLCSSYRSSPYFEYYEDDLHVLFKEKQVYLFDFNLKVFEFVNDALNLELNWGFTDIFEKEPKNMDDWRSKIHPNPRKTFIPDNEVPVKYTQVFETKTGFIPNMSIFDLLFNEGPRGAGLL